MADAPEAVYGVACLDYIDRYIGLAHRRTDGNDNNVKDTSSHDSNIYGMWAFKDSSGMAVSGRGMHVPSILYHIPHDKTKRKIGLVLNSYEDGGKKVAILGNETLSLTGSNFGIYYQEFEIRPRPTYASVLGQPVKNPFDTSPNLTNVNVTDDKTNATFSATRSNGQSGHIYNAAEVSDWQPLYYKGDYGGANGAEQKIFSYQGGTFSTLYPVLTNSKTNTLVFGDNPITDLVYVTEWYQGNPLAYLGGDLMFVMNEMSQAFNGLCPEIFNDGTAFTNFDVKGGIGIHSYNGVALPFNLILTENETQAIRYLDTGVLPSDAFLYPLDWDNMPLFNPNVPDDDDDDGGDPDNDGDRTRVDEVTPLVNPHVVPSVFDANNVYLLNMGNFHRFMTFFWRDIQQFSILNPTTWDDLFENIQGLYADLASAVISCRYMPINWEWVGGKATNDIPIIVGQVQTPDKFPTLVKATIPEPRDIGHIKIQPKFNSYLDLSPYTELQLFLPYYGYVDLDVDMLMGHTLYVKGVYDWVSGTIQYYLYYDNKFLINFYLAKIAVDVPLTLQTAYDRDRAVQSNVINALSGFMSAGASALEGNPIGMTLSAGAVASPQQSAPIKVEGMGGESGFLYQPSRCAIILRRPTTTKKGDAYARTVGYAWAKSKKLGDTDSPLQGLTICQKPRIAFDGNEYIDEEGHGTGTYLRPLASEIEKIYQYLEEGVIL